MENNNSALRERYEIDESIFTPEELEEIYSVVSAPRSRTAVAEPLPQAEPAPAVQPEPEIVPQSTIPPSWIPAPEVDAETEPEAIPVKKKKEPRPPKPLTPLRVIGRSLCFVLATVVIILSGALGVLYMLSHGPSDSARDLFVLSVRETSAVGFLSEIFLSDEEIDAIVNSGQGDLGADSVDTSLITVEHNKKPEDGTQGPSTEILDNDPDGDGIEIVDVVGSTFNGKLMIISDPSRVIVSVSEHLGAAGETLESMITRYGAVAGVNGGGFYDPGGGGNGGTPDGVVIHDGQLLYGGGTYADTAVIDYDGILHVGRMTGNQAMELNARWAVSFGPVLIVNGEKCDGLVGGLNPRTAIGQRADGAILLLVINGRQLDSMGATYENVADVLLSHGAVNALNLDGGSSSNMMLHGEYLNVSASLIGVRGLPTGVLVLEEGGMN